VTERPLAGRTALVTGASRGIGAAIARRLAASGARVALLARSEDALRRLANELGADTLIFPCDVRDPEAVARTILAFGDASGGVPDIVVNNAGAFLIASAQETSVQQFEDTIAVNLVAPFAIVHTLLPLMRIANSGHIVTIGSVADRVIFPGNAAYAASKYGLRALHEVLRAELRSTGIRVSLVSPGPVNTPLWDAIDPDRQPGFTPRASMLTPEAVAEAVHFVVSAPEVMNVDELRLSHR